VLADELLNANIGNVIMQLEEFDKPFVDIDSKSVIVEISNNLAMPGKEEKLKKFLKIAENIVDAVAQ